MKNECETRIQQFRQMVEADPDNELGHFSLGRACLDAGRFDDAVVSFKRVLQLNPKMSKAYQLLGEAFARAGRRKEGVELVTRGIRIANQQGDRMPRDAMADLLRKWGTPVPTFKETAGTAPAVEAAGASTAGFSCSRCRSRTGQLAEVPFKGPLGRNILAKVCAACWREWIGMGTKVINELGLTLSSPAGQDAYDQYMVEFLQLQDD